MKYENNFLSNKTFSQSSNPKSKKMCEKIELGNPELQSSASSFVISIPVIQSPLLIYHTTHPLNNWACCTFPNCIDIATRKIDNLPKHVSGLTCDLHYNQFSNHIEQNHHIEQSTTPKKRKRKEEKEDDKKIPYRVIRPIIDRTYVTRGRKAEEKQITLEITTKQLMIPLSILCDHACFLYDELLAECRKINKQYV